MPYIAEFNPGPRDRDFVDTRSRPELADFTDAYRELAAAATGFVRSKVAHNTLYWDHAQNGGDGGPTTSFLAASCRLHSDAARLSTAVAKMALIVSRYSHRTELDRAGWLPWEIVAERINLDCAMSLLHQVAKSCYPLALKFPENWEETERPFNRRRGQISAPRAPTHSERASSATLECFATSSAAWLFQKADPDAETTLADHVVTITFPVEREPIPAWEM